MNFRFLILVLLAAGAHAWLFWFWRSDSQPAVLPLAVAEMSVEVLPSPAAAPTNTPVDTPPDLKPLPPLAREPLRRHERPIKDQLLPVPPTPLQAEPEIPLTLVEEKPASPQKPVKDKQPAQPSTPPSTPAAESPQGVLTEAKITGNQKPAYPEAARLRRLQGTVGLWLRVTETGKVKGIKLDQSSGHRILDQETIRFARTLRFIPARRGKKPVPHDYYYSVRYRLVR